MTTVSDQSLQNKSQRGFAPLAIARINGAQRANQIAIYLIYAAILAFMVFGTIASIKAFHDNQLLYQLFYNLPYALVALTIPITIYDALVIYRYRLNQPSMIAMSIGVRSEEHTSELQSRENLVCRLLLEKKNKFILVHSKHKNY